MKGSMKVYVERYRIEYERRIMKAGGELEKLETGNDETIMNIFVAGAGELSE